MLAIDHKVPKVLTLKQMLQKYVEFQDEVVRRRTQYDLKKAKERAHILEGLKKATDIVDELIATIRACKGGMAEAGKPFWRMTPGCLPSSRTNCWK